MSNPKSNAMLFRVALAAALFWALAALPRLAFSAEQRVALVIGNSAYPSAPLRNPVNDANAMADKLRALGFEVILRTNVNFRDMTRAVSQFGQKMTPGSVGLFYYAGHGLQVRGKNFLVPVDAEIDSEASVRSESVDLDQVLDQFASSRLSMVILDACRNNPFERRFRTGQGGGLAQIDAPKGTLIAYSTAPGKTAADGAGANGVYTEQLLKAMDAPGIKVEDVFKQVRINVAQATQDQQIPWEASSLTGEFFFRITIEMPALAAPVAVPAPQVDPVTIEMAFWDSIKASTNRAEYEAYLEQYPKGKFAGLARSRITTLEQQKLAAANPQPVTPASASPVSDKERAELLKTGLTGILWQFGTGSGKIWANMLLRPDGTIGGYSHPNESRWALEGDDLLFYSSDGRPSTRFNAFQKENGQWIITGPFLLEGKNAPLHVLREVGRIQAK